MTIGEGQTAKEIKENKRLKKEKLAGLFFDMTKLTYTALVLGAVVLFFQSDKLDLRLFGMFFCGGLVAYGWAKVGMRTLK